MSVSKRDVLKGLFVGGIVTQMPTASWAIPDNTQSPPTFTLNNGLRVHLSRKESGYVSAALVLRSKHIDDPRGLAHIMEHTSFTGAAGSMTAKQIKDLHSDCVQESNATTGGGMIQWHASVLSKNTAQLLELLANTSLDQKFDVETVASESRIVLQELYLDKFDAQGRIKQQFNSALYGPSHPFAHDTTETEIATARTPAPILAAELAQYSRSLKLPANMDLFMVGDFDPDQVAEMVRKSFGRFAFAEGPGLEVPHVGMTRGHKSIKRPVEWAKAPPFRNPHRMEYGGARDRPSGGNFARAGRVPQQSAVHGAAREIRRQLYAGSLVQGRQLLGYLQHQDPEQQQS